VISLGTANYGCLANVQVMAGVTVKEGASPADAELTMYLAKAASGIFNSNIMVTKKTNT
jgi:hypothetical protein